MHTPASIAKHPIHPMIIVFPVGLWIFSLICDLAALATGDADSAVVWSVVAFYTMVGGLVGALVAAVPGLIDLLSLKDPEVKKIAITHMSINLAVVALYIANIWLRTSGTASNLPVGLSVLTVLMLAVSGWLGGEMVHVHGVGVESRGDRRQPDPASEQAAIAIHGERRMASRFG